MINSASFFKKMAKGNNHVKRLESLCSRYRKEMPSINAQWDLSPESVRHNDINESILAGGISIYRCGMEGLWKGIYEPEIYEAHTIWSNVHFWGKITGVIEAWELGLSLSPLFLVKHGTLSLGLVADGKHRLTVCRAIDALDVPFMVAASNERWVKIAFAGAERIAHLGP